MRGNMHEQHAETLRAGQSHALQSITAAANEMLAYIQASKAGRELPNIDVDKLVDVIGRANPR